MTVKVTLAAVIPTTQYGNLQPSFEVEGDTHEQAMEQALHLMKDVWDRTADKSTMRIRELDTAPKFQGEPLRCWASGTRVHFDAENHVYDSGDGKRWLSGSTFAHRYKTEFNAGLISKKMGDKHGVDPAHILTMWELNRDVSSTVGTAVHLALQLRGQYGQLSRAVKDGSLESALTKNPILLPLVEEFFATRDEEEALYEVFVADPVRAHCGLIDRLVIEPDGVWIEDFKTNSDLHKSETIKAPFKGLIDNTKLGAYWLQLSFYGRIIEAHGKHVKGLRIHHWSGDEGWTLYEHELIDIDGAFNKDKD